MYIDFNNDSKSSRQDDLIPDGIVNVIRQYKFPFCPTNIHVVDELIAADSTQIKKLNLEYFERAYSQHIWPNSIEGWCADNGTTDQQIITFLSVAIPNAYRNIPWTGYCIRTSENSSMQLALYRKTYPSNTKVISYKK